MTLKSTDLHRFRDIDFKIIFKCMSGATTENGKFIKPLQEKLTYGDSSDRCESKGFSINCDLCVFECLLRQKDEK